MIHMILKSVIFSLAVLLSGTAWTQTIEKVELQRVACYGSCPVYTVTITSNGAVTFEGEEYVKHKGKAISTISTDDWKLLMTAFQRANFFALRDRYTQEEEDCSRAVTDQPLLKIIATRGQKQKSVLFYYGCYQPREDVKAIQWLGTTIDFITNTQQWVGR